MILAETRKNHPFGRLTVPFSEVNRAGEAALFMDT